MKSTAVELNKIARLLRGCADDERQPNPLRFRNAAAFLASLANSGLWIPAEESGGIPAEESGR